jgi:hypothetical protein
VLGLSCFSALGIAVTGAPTHFPATENQTNIKDDVPAQKMIKVPVDRSMTLKDSVGLLFEINKDDDIYINVLELAKDRFTEKIQSLLDKNKSLTGFCLIPEAVIELSTGEHKPVNKKQYRVPFRLHGVVDDQLQDWLGTSIVLPWDGYSDWNNPLLVVPKRDI